MFVDQIDARGEDLARHVGLDLLDDLVLAAGDAATRRNAEFPGIRIVMSPLFDLNS